METGVPMEKCQLGVNPPQGPQDRWCISWKIPLKSIHKWMITLLGYPHILGNLHMFRVQNLFSVSARFFVSLMSAGLYKPAWQGGSCLSQKSFPTESWINVIHMGFYHQEWWIKHEPLGYLVCKWMDLRKSKTETPGKPVFFLSMFSTIQWFWPSNHLIFQKLSGLQKCSLLTVPKHFQVEMDVSENGIYLQHPPTDHVYYVRKNYDTLW